MVRRVTPVPSIEPTPTKRNPNPVDRKDKKPADPGFKEVLEKVRGKSNEDLPDNFRRGGMTKSTTKPGLYANIHAKRKRIAAGSGEKMRPVGAKGAPTKQAFVNSAKTAKRSARGR